VLTLLPSLIKDVSEKEYIRIMKEQEASPATIVAYNVITIEIRKIFEKPIEKIQEFQNTYLEKRTNKYKENNNLKALSLPSLSQLEEYINKLYKDNNYGDFILNYLLVKYGVRNMDIDCIVCDTVFPIENNKNYLVIDDENKEIVWIRNVYKTVKQYGKKIITIKDNKFYKAVIEASPKKPYLTIKTEAIAQHIMRRTLLKIGEGDIFKILVKDALTMKANQILPRLQELSNNRGTSIDTIINSYNISI
jgi:hypothetical protein